MTFDLRFLVRTPGWAGVLRIYATADDLATRTHADSHQRPHVGRPERFVISVIDTPRFVETGDATRARHVMQRVQDTLSSRVEESLPERLVLGPVSHEGTPLFAQEARTQGDIFTMLSAGVTPQVVVDVRARAAYDALTV